VKDDFNTLHRLMEHVGHAQDLSARQTSDMATDIVDAIRHQLRGHGEIRISGLGTLRVKPTKARTARNPRTGEAVNVPAGKRLAFKPSAEFSATL
jgi:DNA-binding protein HU-beta